MEKDRGNTETKIFVAAMRRKLAANAHKGGWKDCDPDWLLKRLRQEVDELEEAVQKGQGVLGEAADVANFAMFIADVCGELKM